MRFNCKWNLLRTYFGAGEKEDDGSYTKYASYANERVRSVCVSSSFLHIAHKHASERERERERCRTRRAIGKEGEGEREMLNA